jgi:hypothetical protein
VTTTDDLRFDDLRAVFDAEDEADISMLRFLLPDLPGLSDPATADAAPDAAPAGGGTHEAECRRTRAGLHDYLNRNLQPRHQRRLETHLYGCEACIRAFIDIRQVSWARRAVGITTPIGTDGAPRLKGTS